MTRLRRAMGDSMYFTGNPEIPVLVIEGVGEIPWMRQWMREMGPQDVTDFSAYYRTAILPHLTQEQRAMLTPERILRIPVAFAQYRDQVTAEPSEE